MQFRYFNKRNYTLFSVAKNTEVFSYKRTTPGMREWQNEKYSEYQKTTVKLLSSLSFRKLHKVMIKIGKDGIEGRVNRLIKRLIGFAVLPGAV